MSDAVSAAPSAAPSAQPNPGASQNDPGMEAPNPNMTGEEAKAWVEAQKRGEKKAPPPSSAAQPKEQVSGNTIKEAIAEAKKYKLKVDGQDVEVDEDELKRGYSHQKAANKILQEGKLARKQAEEFISMMRDPEKFFEVAKKLGHDPRTLAEKKLAAELEEELLDPREKEFRAMKRELDLEKAEKARRQAEEDEKVHRTLKEKYSKEYSDQFVAALQSTNLPPTKQTIAEMASYVGKAAKMGFKLTASEAAQLVKEDIQAKTQRLFAEADGDVLINLLGEQVANKVRKWDTSRLRSPEQRLQTPDQQSEPRAKRQPQNRRMTASEWREFNRK